MERQDRKLDIQAVKTAASELEHVLKEKFNGTIPEDVNDIFGLLLATINELGE